MRRRFGTRVMAAAVEPVDAASSAFFRIAFGLAMVLNACLYLPRLVHEYYVEPDVHFPYGPLTLVRPLPAVGMYLVYVGMAVAGGLIAAGKWYRPACAAFFVLTTYVFLLDSTYFQNHEYLISLLSLLMVFLPLDGHWSLDARTHPDRASATVPRWVVWLLRFQIGVPYVFGGIAKLNADWLAGEPLRAWLGARTAVEPMSTILHNGGVVWFMTYGALLLDLLVVPLLLNRRTRLPAFVVVTCFHLLNAWLFGLFIFPWLMIAATTIFFPPDWPRRWEHLWTGEPATPPPPTHAAPSPAGARAAPLRPVVTAALAMWVLVQVAVPLRHHLLPGNPSWTEQGHRFAWHMMLRAKGGSVTFVVTDDDRTWRVDPADELSDKQAARLAGHPERIWIYAQHLAEQHPGAEVRAETSVSLNGRRPQPIVDPSVDLAAADYSWRGSAWILPLREPLPDRT